MMIGRYCVARTPLETSDSSVCVSSRFDAQGALRSSPLLPLRKMTKGSNARVAQAMALASAAAAGSAFSMMAAPQGSQSRIVTRASGPSPASAPSSGGVAV